MSRFAYIGSYSPPNGNGIGITVYRVDPSSPEKLIEPPIQIITNPSPSFFCLNRSRTRLYAVNELNEFEGQSGTVTSFNVDLTTGLLTQLNVRSSNGYLPCHLALDQSETKLLIANYGTGSILVSQLSGDDGSLEENNDQFVEHVGTCGPNESRQEGPHPHMVYYLNDTNQVLVPDLGLDRVVVYNYIDGKLTTTGKFLKAPSGSGPRHVTLSNNGRFLYVINELSSTISVFPMNDLADIDGCHEVDGKSLPLLQVISTLPPSEESQVTSNCAAIVLHPNGNYLYGSNRGHDSIAIFSVDRSTGHLTLIGHQSTLGRTPRFFNIDSTGTVLYVANQDSDSVVTFRIESTTGLLTPTGNVVHVPSPVSIEFI